MIGLAQPLRSSEKMSREHEQFAAPDTSDRLPHQSQEPIGTPISGSGSEASEPTVRVAATERRLPENKVIGVICSGNVAVHRDEVKTAIARGQRPDAVWVCIEPRSDHMTHDVMISLDIEPVVISLNGYWKGEENQWGRAFDERRQWRDMEMLHLCDELIVFHKRTGSSPWRERKKWGEENGVYKQLFVVELGPPPSARGRKGKRPVGA